jgi:hypothetical protein
LPELRKGQNVVRVTTVLAGSGSREQRKGQRTTSAAASTVGEKKNGANGETEDREEASSTVAHCLVQLSEDEGGEERERTRKDGRARTLEVGGGSEQHV